RCDRSRTALAFVGEPRFPHDHTPVTRLLDKVAIVTGGARGIGGAIAAAFAEEGADVVIADVRGEDVAAPVLEAIAASGRRSLLVHADVSDEQQVRAMVDRA